MKNKSGSQSAFLNLCVLIGLLASISAIWLAVFAAANQFNSPLQSSGEAGVSTPKAFAINADQGFNPSPKRSFGPFPTIQLEPVASSLMSPVTVANAGDGSGRLFIVQQEGQILILINGNILPTPFLDIADVVGCCGEQGLLGLAFHPQYATNGFFYVNYTDNAGDTQVVRYTVSAADPNVADPDSAFPILNQDQPFSNHNGGALAFGPDGYLYIPLGDGGSGGDPEENGQDLTTWLGKILRVDVNGDDFPGDPDLNYAVPPDNPFVNDPDALDEIWAYGVRNPWRCTFDRLTGDFFIADVGQGNWEEINFQPAASAGGENYGWDVLEGRHCFEDVPQGSCADFLAGGSTLPVLEYSHALGCSVTGGYRYRGQLYPQLDGIYFYSDLCSGTIWGAIQDQQGRWVSQDLLDSGLTVTTFGEDEEGEVYVADYSGGVLYQIVGTGPTPTPTATATATATVTVTPTATVSPSPTATASPSPTATTTPTATTSPTPTVSPSPTAPPRATPRPRGTPRPRPTP
jgi:glucose/arabinose dehydrogenase